MPARFASTPSASSRSTRRRAPTPCTRTPRATSATSPSSPTGDGYRWEIPIGPATLRYTATVKDGELYEIGERIVAGSAPQKVFEMRLKRIGDTDWPAAGAVSPK